MSKKQTLMQKMQSRSKCEGTACLEDSKFFEEKDPCRTPVPMINVALSGSIKGGLTAGHTMLAGPSKHFKTSFALCMASAYLKQNPEAVLVFYDCEFGSPKSYFESFGIETDRILHCPFKNVEQLKFDLVDLLDNADKEEDIIIVIDSIGNVASKKEVDDALSESSKADMTRAKALKSLFRMITPYLKMKDIPLLTINHIYMEQGLFPKAIVSGGTGAYYSADNIWIIGRRQDKTGTTLNGYNFIIRIEKSRFVREGSKIPINVSFKGGIRKYSGLLEVAMEGGYVVKPKNGWYVAVKPEEYVPEVKKKGKVEKEAQGTLTKSLREKDTYGQDFWTTVFTNTDFETYIENQFKIAHSDMIEEEIDEAEFDENTEEATKE